MPGLVTMKPVLKARGKAMARAREERGLGALLSQVRFSPAKKGQRRPTDLQAQALGVLDRSGLVMRLRMKLLGEGGEEEEEEVSPVRAAPQPEFEPSSVCLAAMVDEFLEDETDDKQSGRSRFNFDDAMSKGDEESKSFLREQLFAVLHSCVDSSPERILASEVNKAAAAGKFVGDGRTSYIIRHVVRYLRRVGHNAGVCKSRWDHSRGFPGGDYEYIDVLLDGASGRWERILVDVDFKAQFEIARPTAHYDALVQALPAVFVGRQDQLQWIVNVMSDAVKLSLKERGMYLPPWRKPEYMRAKWFSSYIRTTGDFWERTPDEISDGSSDASDVSLVANASVKSSGTFAEPQEPKKMPVVAAIGHPSGSIDNNDWHLPILKTKKCQGPGHAGLASLFKEASLKSSMRKDQMVRVA